MAASADSVRDALALVLCSLPGDQQGTAAVQANMTNPAEVAGMLSDVVAGLFRVHARALVPNGDPLKLLDRCGPGWPGKAECHEHADHGTGRDDRRASRPCAARDKR